MFYKLHNHLAPEIFERLLPPLVSDVSNYSLRNRENYVVPNCRLSVTDKSFIPSTVRLWNSLDSAVREKTTVATFKSSLSHPSLKPPYILYMYHGNRKVNILYTRLRHKCSTLNYDLYRSNLIHDPTCSCGNPCENSFHYTMYF